jgi:S1-C subfamily serine protease
VKPGSPAHQHGLRAGDLIIGVSGRRVSTLKELGNALRTPGNVVLNILRGDTMLSVPIA